MGELLSYARVKPAVNQIESHPFWRNEKTIDFCKSNVRFALLSSGLLGSSSRVFCMTNVLHSQRVISSTATHLLAACAWPKVACHSIVN